MRIIEPRNLKANKKPEAKNRPKRKGVSVFVVALIILLPLVALGSYVYVNIIVVEKEIDTLANATQPSESLGFTVPDDDPFDTTIQPLKNLKGEDFTNLYRSVAYPNAQLIADPPIITGDDSVDERIRQLAEDRGYERTSVPEQAIVRLGDEPRLDTDDLLQPLAATNWRTLKDAASDQGYVISLLSAYRSPDYQRQVFLSRLYELVSLDDLKAGLGDEQIEQTLSITAVPGYSRHHTGYTVDLWCEDGSTSFLVSTCYQWISSDNYKNAMEYGWIPSYPEGSDLQGPEPEPWEYVWVGDAVREPKKAP